jgi:hypothetical protein
LTIPASSRTKRWVTNAAIDNHAPRAFGRGSTFIHIGKSEGRDKVTAEQTIAVVNQLHEIDRSLVLISIWLVCITLAIFISGLIRK